MWTELSSDFFEEIATCKHLPEVVKEILSWIHILQKLLVLELLYKDKELTLPELQQTRISFPSLFPWLQSLEKKPWEGEFTLRIETGKVLSLHEDDVDCRIVSLWPLIRHQSTSLL
jgi:hypothetical protein